MFRRQPRFCPSQMCSTVYSLKTPALFFRLRAKKSGRQDTNRTFCGSCQRIGFTNIASNYRFLCNRRVNEIMPQQDTGVRSAAKLVLCDSERCLSILFYFLLAFYFNNGTILPVVLIRGLSFSVPREICLAAFLLLGLKWQSGAPRFFVA